MPGDRGPQRRKLDLKPNNLRNFDNPIDFIVEEHQRQRQLCALIDRVVANQFIDIEELTEVIDFLGDEYHAHSADEEQDLFPLMRRRCYPEDEIDATLARLLSDHEHANTQAKTLLDALVQAQAQQTQLSVAARRALGEFATLERRHLIVENAIVLPLARARLTHSDLASLRLRMLQRRGIDPADCGDSPPPSPPTMSLDELSKNQAMDALFARNITWATQRQEQEPDYFSRLATRQSPEFFWIGCSDSRVPANVVAGLDPGEVFVHRNVANIIHSSDMNFLSALEFAVDQLHIRQVIVCGHYGCGGIKAACNEQVNGLADYWLEPVRRLERQYAIDLSTQTHSPEARRNRLCELNVIEGVRRVAETPILQRAWARGEAISIHGIIYGLDNGLLYNLDCTISA